MSSMFSLSAEGELEIGWMQPGNDADGQLLTCKRLSRCLC